MPKRKPRTGQEYYITHCPYNGCPQLSAQFTCDQREEAHAEHETDADPPRDVLPRVSIVVRPHRRLVAQDLMHILLNVMIVYRNKADSGDRNTRTKSLVHSLHTGPRYGG